MASEIGRRLLEVREEEHLSREEFVRRLGKGTRRALAHYEGGKAPLPTNLARLVCERFDISFDWLMSGREPRRKSAAIGEVVSRRLAVEARDLMTAIQDVITKHAYAGGAAASESNLRGLLRRALRVTLGMIERDFREDLGIQQFARHLDHLVGTLEELFGEAVSVRKDAIVREALRVHGLEESDCLDIVLREDVVVLVTKGGQKIRWAVGEQPVEIPAHQHPRVKPLPKKM